MKLLLLGLVITANSLLAPSALAAAAGAKPVLTSTPSCLKGKFTSRGDVMWKSITLTITNTCTIPVDFQDAKITFINPSPIYTNFWGNFSPLPYPAGNLMIEKDEAGLASIRLHFTIRAGESTLLPVNSAIQIQYGIQDDTHDDSSVLIDVKGRPDICTLTLINASAKPKNVRQEYALIHLSLNGHVISDQKVRWHSGLTIVRLPAGQYSISADNIIGRKGESYQGTATPANINILGEHFVTSTITYAKPIQTGMAFIQLSLPPQLAGYTGIIAVKLRRAETGSSVSQALTSNASKILSSLINGATYHLSTDAISYNGYLCSPAFDSNHVVANEKIVPSVMLGFNCSSNQQNVEK